MGKSIAKLSSHSSESVVEGYLLGFFKGEIGLPFLILHFTQLGYFNDNE